MLVQWWLAAFVLLQQSQQSNHVTPKQPVPAMELPLLQILPCIVPISEYSSSVINVCCASVLARVTDMMASHLRSSSFPWVCLKQSLLCQISSCLTRCMHSCSMCSDTRNNTSLLEHGVECNGHVKHNKYCMWTNVKHGKYGMWTCRNTRYLFPWGGRTVRGGRPPEPHLPRETVGMLMELVLTWLWDKHIG